jgi:exodeoxyribonuclease VII large subunit
LWAFNEEQVARAIYNSKIPIISAVGHETDFSISDFVADLRAPTPSAAAEIASFDAESYKTMLLEFARRIRNALRRNTKLSRERLERLVASRSMRSPLLLLESPAQRLDDLSNRLARSAEQLLTERRNRFALLKEKLTVLSPQSVLRRGYAVVRKSESGELVKSIRALDAGVKIGIELADGKAAATVDEVSREE